MSITQARAIVGQNLGFGSDFDGSIGAYQNLSQADQIRLTDALGAYIKANPASFTDQQQSVATDIVNAPLYNQPLADTSLLGNASAGAADFMNRLEGFGNKVTAIVLLGVALFVYLIAEGNYRRFVKK